MRVALACLACTVGVGCGFQAPGAVSDASDGPPSDVMADVPPDQGPAGRITTGLIGLWEFNEVSGTTIGDTSNNFIPVPLVPIVLTVNPGAVTFSNGTMTIATSAVIASAVSPHHLDLDVKTSNAVTLEVWVMPSSTTEGSAAQPVTIAGLCANINSRDISLMQADNKWVARVRTGTQAEEGNGLPELTSTTDVNAAALTHLVIVSDAAQKILYVNGQPNAIDLIHAPPGAWENYHMTLGNEGAENRQWTGTLALVAMYRRALSAAEVLTNFTAGP